LWEVAVAEITSALIAFGRCNPARLVVQPRLTKPPAPCGFPERAATNGIRSLFGRKISLFGATIFAVR
jgi:hypothetical protein